MIIPMDQMNQDTLKRVIEDWLSRQSQDWVGTFEERELRVAQIVEQLKRKQLLITWDDESQTINIISSDSVMAKFPDEFGY